MILYIENPRISTKIIRINEFRNVSGYKINIQKSVAFLCTNNELSDGESKKKKNLLKNHIKKNKIPRNKLNEGGGRPIF